ncbi:putative Insecticidal toxin protein [Pseudomonas syringae pv. coriandricola]|uniref:Putative Insecticidal toxin protein n=1 Tax=Pseudomonas syringae pv. coriandricola TaxID=264453 RepID=A0A3M4UCN6_9PSED|nr:RHS repeat-associated core domain-containing protein [Pseudomonas syringae group genomosp. 3]RMR36769.1 putative Insecticidal toxin protein [Pseudomonas syringae pv. coriandricola]RMU02071.1 putative Insecticidal toxin protein [Pseudomonas syringae pv. coriandricola]
MNSIMHTNTPQLAVSDSRGLSVRSVQFYRGADGQPVEARVTQHYFDKAGRLIASRDPRFSSRLKYDVCAPVNLMQIVSLSGALLLSKSVDSGWRVSLNGEAGQLVDSCDGRDNPRQIEYDRLLRPLAINESGRMTERFTYGGPATAEHNQCNQLIRHDDTAGSRLLHDYGLLGDALCEKRHFLQAPESPDWPLAEAERYALLELVGLQTRWGFNALGEVLVQTDAMGNTQAFGMTVAGQLKAAELTLAGAAQSQTLVSEIRCNALDQVEQETAGNGVVSHFQYDPQDSRLAALNAMAADGALLQKLIYSYDPVGNVLVVNDASQPDRYCDNQLIESISRFGYDTLYQMIEASGREVRNGASHGPALPGLQSLPTDDPCQVSNYTQRYSYDAAGNMLQMRHEGAHNFTRNMHVAPDSNRSLPDDDGDVDFATSFDANGNLLQLVRGQTMSWDARNQLQHITTVQRKDAPNDDERYVYDGQGQRCRKISTSQASGRTLTDEVRYLPGLEIRTTADGEILHVVTAQAGRNSVRVLHWEAGKPDSIANDQVRYSLGDHLGSSTLELDQQGGLISQESYYPFGGTAWWAARSAVEAKYKTVRYSGKERDASGLYYYGFRYYAPWLQRWINPDPAGDVDGLNLYRMVRNNPLVYVDAKGQQPEPVPKTIHQIWIGENKNALRAQVSNINRTVEMAWGYKVKLHLETRTPEAYSEIEKDLRSEVVLLPDSQVFQNFKEKPLYAAYEDFRRNNQNYAFAVDVLRMHTVHELGGIYSDVYDVYAGAETGGMTQLGDNPLFAEPDEVLTLDPVHVPWEPQNSVESFMVNNSSFAAHSGAGVLLDMMGEGAKRYDEAVEGGSYPDPTGMNGIGLSLLWNPNPAVRVRTLSNVVGPGLFTDTLHASDTAYGELFSNLKGVVFQKQPFTFADQMARKMPLHRHIKSGAAQTWR